LEFHIEKKLNLHVGAHKYWSNLHKPSLHMKSLKRVKHMHYGYVTLADLELWLIQP